jgi:predicted nucleotidyltransferase
MSAGRWASSGPDYSQQYKNEAAQLARRFAVMEGVVGVLLSGGLTFGEADRHSDIDLYVYLRQQSLRTWYFGEAPLPEGESRYHNLRLDVSYLDYEHERERSWGPVEQWAASRAEVLYDPEELLGQLLQEKLRSPDAIRNEAMDVAANIRFLLERRVPAWLYRGESLAAHQVLNQATSDLVRLIHLVNKTPGPESGWDIALLNTLDFVPGSWAVRVSEIFDAGDLSADTASKRRYALTRVLYDCWARLAPAEPFEDRADVVRQRQMLRELAERGQIPLAEFRQTYEPHLLIQLPAFELVWIDREVEEFQVRFNHKRLQQLIHHELGRFLDFQQRILRDIGAAAGSDVDS